CRMVAGTRADIEALRQEITAVPAPMGLKLSAAKTKVVHLGAGFDFLRAVRSTRRIDSPVSSGHGAGDGLDPPGDVDPAEALAEQGMRLVGQAAAQRLVAEQRDAPVGKRGRIVREDQVAAMG